MIGEQRFEKKDRTPATAPVRRQWVSTSFGQIEVWMDADDEQVWKTEGGRDG